MKDEGTELKFVAVAGEKSGLRAEKTIIVRQVVGEKEKQKVMDVQVKVPEGRPAIEQIIEVFVKKVEVTNIDVLTDRLIVRGEFCIKVIYIACLPESPVHALEVKHCKWTQDIDMPGVRRGMEAEVTAVCEFVDYDVAEMSRAYKYKYGGDDCDDSCTSSCSCDELSPQYPVFKKSQCMEYAHSNPCMPKPPCLDVPEVQPAIDTGCIRSFDVSVILRVMAKVLADREVQLNCTSGEVSLPTQPKG